MGIIGALVATLGNVLPSFVMILIISKFLDSFLELTIIANAFKGIKISVGILIFDAAITMIKKMHKKVLSVVIMGCSLVVMLLINIFSLNFSSISLMLIAAMITLIIFLVKGSPKQKGASEK